MRSIEVFCKDRHHGVPWEWCTWSWEKQEQCFRQDFYSSEPSIHSHRESSIITLTTFQKPLFTEFLLSISGKMDLAHPGSSGERRF